MPQVKVTVFRPRLERVELRVNARNRYEANSKAFEIIRRAEEGFALTDGDAPPAEWEMLPVGADFYLGSTSYSPELFIVDDERPKLFDDDGGHKEL